MLSVKDKTRKTKEFLQLVAQHLSGREDCKGVNYRVTLGEDKAVVFEPVVMVYPNRHQRKDSDKRIVTRHVLAEHMAYIFEGTDDSGNAKIDTDWIIPGTYEYQSTYDNKKRRWVRIS